MEISIKVEVGPEGWQNVLNALANGAWVKSGSVQAADHMAKVMQEYPPDRGYPRTHKLKEGWHSELVSWSPDVTRAVAVNTVWYGPYVQSKEEQAEQHIGFWPTDAEQADREAEEIANIYVKALKNMAGISA